MGISQQLVVLLPCNLLGLWLSQEDPFHVSVVVNGGSSSELLQCFQGEHD